MTDPFELLRSDLLGAAARIEAARPARRRAALRWRPLALVAAALVVSGSAAAGVLTLTSAPSQPLSGRVPGAARPLSSRGPTSIAGYRYAIQVTPELSAGAAGWEVATALHAPPGAGGGDFGGGGGGGYPTRAVPIFQGRGMWQWGASSSDPTTGQTVVFVLTGPQVAAVRAGTRTIRTTPSSQLPAGDRAAVFFWPAAGPQLTLGWRPGQPVRSHMVLPSLSALPAHGRPSVHRVTTEALLALDGAGHALPTGEPSPTELVYRFWQSPRALTPNISQAPYHGPTRPARGACEITARGLPALIPAWGSTIDHVAGLPDALGEVLLSCVSTEYYLHDWPLTAAVLVDARRPGTRPGPIPGARAVPGRAGTVDYAAASLTARRAGSAWLVVRGGSGLAQRLQVLHALQITGLRLSLSRR